jgi:hypothetical protein
LLSPDGSDDHQSGGQEQCVRQRDIEPQPAHFARRNLWLRIFCLQSRTQRGRMAWTCRSHRSVALGGRLGDALSGNATAHIVKKSWRHVPASIARCSARVPFHCRADIAVPSLRMNRRGPGASASA